LQAELELLSGFQKVPIPQETWKVELAILAHWEKFQSLKKGLKAEVRLLAGLKKVKAPHHTLEAELGTPDGFQKFQPPQERRRRRLSWGLWLG
jgi:hypothetical protein